MDLAQRKAELERELQRGRVELERMQATIFRIQGALTLIMEMEREQAEAEPAEE